MGIRYTLPWAHEDIVQNNIIIYISRVVRRNPIIIFSSGWLNNILYKSPLHRVYNVRAYPPNGFQCLTSRPHISLLWFSSSLLLSTRHVAFVYTVARARTTVETWFACETICYYNTTDAVLQFRYIRRYCYNLCGYVVHQIHFPVTYISAIASAILCACNIYIGTSRWYII